MKAFFPSRRWSARLLRPGCAGFTLVEVCLALGIIAFAVLPLVGLLSIGLDSYRNAVLRMRATQALNQIATSLRRAPAVVNPATGVSTGQYTALPPLPQQSGNALVPVQWALAATTADAASNAKTYTLYFDENGSFLSNVSPVAPKGTVPPAGARIAAAVIVTPPTTKYDSGTAQISVGWPVTPISGPFYTSPSFIYGAIQGHVDNIITLSSLPAQ